MKTRIQDPVFCLTASITLREKPNEGVILGYTSFSQNPSRIDLSPDQQPLVGQDDLEDVDLLGGLGKFSHKRVPLILIPLNFLSFSQRPYLPFNPSSNPTR